MGQLVEYIVHIDGVTGLSPVATTKSHRIARFEDFLFSSLLKGRKSIARFIPCDKLDG